MPTAALIAVQLEVGPDVLATPEAYRRHLEEATGRAVGGANADVRIVVLPEVAGHLAIYAHSPARRAKTLGGALARAAVRRPLEVLRGVATTRLLDARHAVLAALAPDAERWWKSVFGPLAKKLGAWIVAGSHLRLAPGGELTNASLTFDPGGRIAATTDKVNLVPGIEDAAKGGLALARGDADAIPIVETPAGKLATLICYDGFYKPHTPHERFVPVAPRLVGRGVTFVANPAANPWPWRERWPFDDRVREAQWEAEGLPGTLREIAFARYGITAHLVGRVLDLHFDGTSEILERSDAGVIKLARMAEPDRGGHLVAVIST